MPKPAETSPIRRVLMQSIMWVILIGTVGLAALVDAKKSHSAAVTLGPPQRIEDFSLCLPKGWTVDSDSRDQISDAALAMREPLDDPAARMIYLQVQQPGLADFFLGFSSHHRGAGSSMSTQSIAFGDVSAPLEIVRTTEDAALREPVSVLQLSVSRSLDRGRLLRLSMIHAGVRSAAEQRQDVELVQKVAATLVMNLK